MEHALKAGRTIVLLLEEEYGVIALVIIGFQLRCPIDLHVWMVMVELVIINHSYPNQAKI